MKTFLILSHKRSTHHAFIESFLKEESYVYDNNLTISNGALVPGRTISSGAHPTIQVCSFERRYHPEEIVESKHIIPKAGGNAKFIICIRDPLNTLASTYSVYLKNQSKDSSFPLAYIDHNMMQYERLLNYLRSSELQDYSYVYLNRFWTDHEYRANLSKELGLKFTIFSQVSKFAGGGHSFFGEKSIEPSRLLTRFMSYKSDTFFLDLISKHSPIIASFFDVQSDILLRHEYEAGICAQVLNDVGGL
jgi:hypothetical protein